MSVSSAAISRAMLLIADCGTPIAPAPRLLGRVGLVPLRHVVCSKHKAEIIFKASRFFTVSVKSHYGINSLALQLRKESRGGLASLYRECNFSRWEIA
jgi:hypothetical protein